MPTAKAANDGGTPHRSERPRALHVPEAPARAAAIHGRRAQAVLSPQLGLLAEDALRPPDQDGADDEEHRGVAKACEEVRQQDDQDHLEDAQHEPADHRARQAAEAAQHAGDEGLEHRQQAHEGVDRAAPRDEEDGGEAREEARDRERRRDHPVGPHAHQAHGGEVVGRGAHGEAQLGPPHEDDQQHKSRWRSRPPRETAGW